MVMVVIVTVIVAQLTLVRVQDARIEDEQIPNIDWTPETDFVDFKKDGESPTEQVRIGKRQFKRSTDQISTKNAIVQILCLRLCNESILHFGLMHEDRMRVGQAGHGKEWTRLREERRGKRLELGVV